MSENAIIHTMISFSLLVLVSSILQIPTPSVYDLDYAYLRNLYASSLGVGKILCDQDLFVN